MLCAIIEFHPAWAGPVLLISPQAWGWHCQAKNLLLSAYFLPLYNNSTHQVMEIVCFIATRKILGFYVSVVNSRQNVSYYIEKRCDDASGLT